MARRPPTLPVAGRMALLFLLITIYTIATHAQQITAGPEAVHSLAQEMGYKTGRSCAVGCLVYNGGIPCQAGSFHQDLGVWLGCDRCHQINACYCNDDYASSATSMIDSCVSERCSKAGIADWADEVTKMLGLYSGYCATANVAVVTTSRVRPTAEPKPTTGNAGPTPGPGTGSNAGPADAVMETGTGTATTPTSSATPTGGEEKKGGLSQSDIVALAASLGVGIPSLLIAAITLCVQLKKRKKRREEEGAQTLVGVGSVPGSDFHSLSSTPVPQHGHVFAAPANGWYQGAPEIRHTEGIPLQHRGFRY